MAGDVDAKPASTRLSPNAGLMLCHRRRRWHNIKPALDERPVFAGNKPFLCV